MSESSGERVAGSWTRRRLMGIGAALAARGRGGSALRLRGAGHAGRGRGGEPQRPAGDGPLPLPRGAPGSQEPTLYDEQMPLFMQKYPNIKVVHEGFTGEDFIQKITVLSAGAAWGTRCGRPSAGASSTTSPAKVIQPVEPYVAKEKFDLTQYYKNVIEGLKRDGKLYGLPFKSHPGVSVMFYNQTAYEKVGAVPDKTWTLDRLMDGAKRATQGDVFGYNPSFAQKSILTTTRAFGGECSTRRGRSPSSTPPGGAGHHLAVRDHQQAQHRPQAVCGHRAGGWTGCSPTASSPPGSGGRPSSSSRSGTSRTPSSGSPPCTPRPAGVPGSDYEADAYSMTTVTKIPDGAWQWTKWLTNQESGIRLGEIGGTVGGRPDVYKSERLLKDPIRRVFLEAMETAQPGRPVYNTRFDEYEKVMQGAWRRSGRGSRPPPRPSLTSSPARCRWCSTSPCPKASSGTVPFLGGRSPHTPGRGSDSMAYWDRRDAVQGFLAQQGWRGWLLMDFRGSNPLLWQVLGRGQGGHLTRRTFLWIPAGAGEVVALPHDIERGALVDPAGRPAATPGRPACARPSAPWGSEGGRPWPWSSPWGEAPYVSRVDGGTRPGALPGAEVVSSADLLQLAIAQWDERQVAAPRAQLVDQVKDEAFRFVGERLRAGAPVDEREVAQGISAGFAPAG